MKRLSLSMVISTSLLAVAASAAAQTKLDVATTYSGTNIFAENLREFSKRVEKATNGEVKLVVHEGGALGLKDEDHFSAVADGIVPVASVLMGAAVGSAPIFGLSTSPFLVKDFKEAKVLHDIARPYYDREARKFNQKILYTAPWPPSGVFAKKPVTKYEDLKGLKIRTYDRNGTDVLKKAGANAVVMSWGEVYPALATGTIDSVLTSGQSGVSGKFWEVLSDYSRVNFAIPLNMININLDTWNSLTDKQKAAIEKVGKEMEARQWDIAQKAMLADEETLAKNGIKVNKSISKEFTNKLSKDGQQVVDAWVKTVGPDGKKILDEFERKR